MNLLRCLRPDAPNISQLDVLYLSNNDTFNLWQKKDGSPPCSSISPPPLSRCVVCLQEAVYAVCNSVTSALNMEGGGAPIPLTESECPVFMETGEVSTSGGSQDHRMLLLLLLIILLIIAAAVGYWKRRAISAAWQQWKEERNLQQMQAGEPSRLRGDQAEEP
ncbi:uncharacterized protein LOC110367775 isoform X2 [Fundulus heteroclitus]|nr:uncharacterized protein LOC110367775 isoform X2 [Fundulus heteroclitus]XP_035987871.1 uncharacterized protein LOC110367775 isoform X2 [Fundulus heteroclitus]XP_035987872.1 uncharacterized protein LOC110367775 isoform X2 [Fundulus heteroclitus]XP_035987874.1 uncharacterized protein LOC110367775 isoform X2 [Fundulus heteroclitus]XP_035987875.1 uncharacterized protein LOC110367775 isoform X2 [Fundulus heteroclitus]